MKWPRTFLHCLISNYFRSRIIFSQSCCCCNFLVQWKIFFGWLYRYLTLLWPTKYTGLIISTQLMDHRILLLYEYLCQSQMGFIFFTLLVGKRGTRTGLWQYFKTSMLILINLEISPFNFTTWYSNSVKSLELCLPFSLHLSIIWAIGISCWQLNFNS